MLKFSTLLTALMFLIVSSVIAQDTLTNKKDKSQQRIGIGLMRRASLIGCSYEVTRAKGFIYGVDLGFLSFFNGYSDKINYRINVFCGYSSLNRKSFKINHTLGIGYGYLKYGQLNSNLTFTSKQEKPLRGGPPIRFYHFFLSTFLTEFQFRVTERFSISPEIVLFVVPQGRDYYPIVLPFASLNFSFKI